MKRSELYVEIIYDVDCPNVPATRGELLRAFSKTGITPHWKEWERSSPDAPDYARLYGSPTVLVNGQDVAGDAPHPQTSCCRIYSNEMGQNAGVPPQPTIALALQKENQQISSVAQLKTSRWWYSGALPAAPGVLSAFLPKVACPACWPAYAGILTSVGLGFLLNEKYLFTLTAVFLSVTLAALFYSGVRQRRFLPSAVGVGAAVVVLSGKFYFESDLAMYLGLSALVGASLWSSCPVRVSGMNETCPSCVDR